MNYPSSAESAMAAACRQQAYPSGGQILGKPSIPMEAYAQAKAPRAISEIDSALSEHAGLLDDLSQLAIELKSTFSPVLKPEQPEPCREPNAGQTSASPIAERIYQQNNLLRSILSDIRTIRDRSAV